MTTALDWHPAGSPVAALPFGWTDADLATLANMAQEFGIAPLEIMALFYSESGLNPHAGPEGLAGLTPVVEQEMGWPSVTIKQLNAGPVTGYLQAVFQLWAHVQEKYVGKTFVSKGKEWGVSPGTALYTFHGFLGPALSAHGPQAILGQKPPVWPVVWANGDWSYNGAPVSAELGRKLTGPEVLYAGNPGLAGLAGGSKDTITIADMGARVKRKAQELQANPTTAKLYDRLQGFETLPSGQVPPLSDLFGAVSTVWKNLTGTSIRTKVAATTGEAPNTSPTGTATPEPSSGATAAAGSAGGALLLAAGIALVVWQLSKKKS